MSLTIRLTGTDGAQLVPIFGCDCTACRRARREENHRRRPHSGVITFNSAVTLLDAERPDLMKHHPASSFQQVLLIHYRLDHVQGPLPPRRGVGASIPVYGPPDDAGCDDLLKHPGLLDFSHTVTPFVVFDLQGLRVTPLPLNHSKLTFGYLLELVYSRVAWLSDTAGLSNKTLKFLLNNRPQAMIIDCSHELRAQTSCDHSDLNTVRHLDQMISYPRVILTHISHQLDVWMMDNPLLTDFEAGCDGMEIVLDQVRVRCGAISSHHPDDAGRFPTGDDSDRVGAGIRQAGGGDRPVAIVGRHTDTDCRGSADGSPDGARYHTGHHHRICCRHRSGCYPDYGRR